ncbi:MAG: M1 family aminopeptidase [Gemmatimonadota bacterium]
MPALVLQLLTGIVSLAIPGDTSAPAAGVSRELAELRRREISDVRYDLDWAVPESAGAALRGRALIRFRRRTGGLPIVLDFNAPAGNVGRVRSGDRDVPYRMVNEHLIIDGSHLPAGEQALAIEFTSTDLALNRNADFFYTLFVPDRARSALPCFDQPDLKGRFRLTLRIPAGWHAVANGRLAHSDTSGATQVLEFAETRPIPTYLFAVAAGKFFVETAERDGRTFHLYHRETDSSKVARNRAAIFDLEAASLRWLERYTGIPFPFDKFDFFAVPAFQFGGMEHPGAVWYRAGGLFLDEAATRNQLLGRASLIAHETAHMWFGDLVTMRWFNDVWMKEVFANFMAGKIAGPSFPDINHELRFYLAHYPGAYAVDRTAGANPIRQDLENLNEAGSVYGAIIYDKAPIVMRQLERLIGEASMRKGLRVYLREHRYGNATWADLIAILARVSGRDLSSWSKAWVEAARRPTVTATRTPAGISVHQSDPNGGRGLRWAQRVEVALGYGDSVRTMAVELRGAEASIRLGSGRPDFVMLGANGVGYGRFVLDSASRIALLDRVPRLKDPLMRSVAWASLYESVIAGELDPRDLLARAVDALGSEHDELVSEQVLGLIQATYWRLLPDEPRRAVAAGLEATLWRELEAAPTPGRKVGYFNALVGVTLTPDGLARLEAIWRTRTPPAGLPLSDEQYTTLAEAIALRGVPNADPILDEQLGRIRNPDRQARFRFVRPALSADVRVRDSVFQSLSDPANRRREPWVLDVVRYLHHPLRAATAEKYIPQSLAMIEEIKRTGDIFFPLGWLSATLDGHQTATAAAMVTRFLAGRPDLAPRLRGKVLQAADGLFQAAAIVERRKSAVDNER